MKFKIHSQSRILDDFFKVDEAYVSFERFNGEMTEPVRRLNFERGDAVAALVFNQDRQTIILTNQFRFPTVGKDSGWIVEVPAGMLPQEESAEDCIRREILEEIGYEVDRLEHIHTFYVSPGGTSERIILFYAEVADAGRANDGGGVKAEHEDIELVELKPEDAFRDLEKDKFADAKTIIALMWLQARQRRDG